MRDQAPPLGRVCGPTCSISGASARGAPRQCSGGEYGGAGPDPDSQTEPGPAPIWAPDPHPLPVGRPRARRSRPSHACLTLAHRHARFVPLPCPQPFRPQSCRFTRSADGLVMVKRTPASSSQAPKAKRPPAKSCEDKAAGSLDASSSKRRRQLDRRNTEERAERALQTHCKGVSMQRLATTQVGGRTARDCVVEAIRNSPRNSRLGQTFWRELSQQYGFDDSDVKLKPRSKSDVVGDDLAGSLALCFDPNPATRTVSSLSSVLSARSALNQRELIGLLNALPSMAGVGVAKGSIDQLWLDVAKCVARLSWVILAVGGGGSGAEPSGR